MTEERVTSSNTGDATLITGKNDYHRAFSKAVQAGTDRDPRVGVGGGKEF